ncbi:MAG: DEAD/DEAH box helicase [Gemmatimonadota bacterium]
MRPRKRCLTDCHRVRGRQTEFVPQGRHRVVRRAGSWLSGCEAREKSIDIQGIQKAKEDERCRSAEIEATTDNAAVRDALASGEIRLAAGTAWLWSREEMAGSVDVLFVDEAGQLSLANALAVSQAAGSLVLLGDPRQLEQPQQGIHPPGADVSALDHLLGDEATVSPDRGLFLDRTWRLHPEICAFTSEIFYRDRLESELGLERQVVHGPEPLNGSGLRLVTVEHAGNQSESHEEVQEVVRLVESALSSRATWVDMDGNEKRLTIGDILVVAPYNAQVSALLEALPAGARVGTVDKFQGQEAAIVIYSMTTSSAGDAPRGMDFLYSPNRLNVATSRARCLTVVVASPAVFVPDCRTPAQMKLANAFCRYREISARSVPEACAPPARARSESP